MNDNIYKLQIGMILLKIAGFTAYSWFIIFIPMYFLLAKFGVLYIFGIVFIKKLNAKKKDTISSDILN